MPSIPDSSISLALTSPPYFNARFDSPNFYASYGDYLSFLGVLARQGFRVLGDGRLFALNIDDVRIDGRLYPVVADATTIFLEAGFGYRDKIVWVKPDVAALRQRQSGVAIQHPYPMYPRFTNVTESILVFAKGRFDYKSVSENMRQESKIDRDSWIHEWSRNVWYIRNVPPNMPLERGIAAFPEEIPRRLVMLFSHKHETVIDPCLGSGTTMKVARSLERDSVGIELKPELAEIIRRKAFPDEESKDHFVVIPPGSNQLLVSHPRSAISSAPSRNPGKPGRGEEYPGLLARLGGEENQTCLRSRGGGR
ncbi:MAG: DNA-methyltransferase [Candidatus Bathyarchaeia archaeon]